MEELGSVIHDALDQRRGDVSYYTETNILYEKLTTSLVAQQCNIVFGKGSSTSTLIVLLHLSIDSQAP